MDKQHYIPSDDNNEGTYKFYSELAAKAERDSRAPRGRVD